MFMKKKIMFLYIYNCLFSLLINYEKKLQINIIYILI